MNFLADFAGILLVALATGVFVYFAVTAILRARANPVRTGTEGLVGEAGRVVVELSPRGRVAVRGEIWDARLAAGDGPVPVDAGVRVTRAQGLVLWVEAVPAA